MAVDAGVEDLPDLPPPGPSQLEIRFRRLLHKCEERARAQRASDAPGAAAPWQADPKFHCYVEALRELLFDLEASQAEAPGPDVLSAYKAHVAWLGRELRPPEVPAFCRRIGDKSLAAVAGGIEPLPAGTPADDLVSTSGRGGTPGDAQPSQPARPARGGGNANGGGGGGGGGSAGPVKQVSVSAAARERLRTQQRLQDELADDMLGLTAEMKAGAMAMQSALRYRGQLLDQTESALVDSTANAQSVHAKAKERYRAARGSFCWTCMMLLAVSAVFAATLAYIKLTSMVGITGRRARAPAAAHVPPAAAGGGGQWRYAGA